MPHSFPQAGADCYPCELQIAPLPLVRDNCTFTANRGIILVTLNREPQCLANRAISSGRAVDLPRFEHEVLPDLMRRSDDSDWMSKHPHAS
jgi:hypothetical protein